MKKEMDKDLILDDKALDDVTGGTKYYNDNSDEASTIRSGNCPSCGSKGTVSEFGYMVYTCSQCHEFFRLEPFVRVGHDR